MCVSEGKVSLENINTPLFLFLFCSIDFNTPILNQSQEPGGIFRFPAWYEDVATHIWQLRSLKTQAVVMAAWCGDTGSRKHKDRHLNVFKCQKSFMWKMTVWLQEAAENRHVKSGEFMSPVCTDGCFFILCMTAGSPPNGTCPGVIAGDLLK